MSISMLIEPAETGFRATTGSPLNLSAEGKSAGQAVAVLRSMIQDKLSHGSILIEQSFTQNQLPIPITPLADNPLFNEWLEAVSSGNRSIPLSITEPSVI
jgi:hypothetical protein